MKKILLSILVFIAVNSWSQRQMDLGITIVSPAMYDEVPLNELVNFDIVIENQGIADLTANDSLRVYVEIDGDAMVFQPGNMLYMIRTGNYLAAGSSMTITFPGMFTDGFENLTFEMCYTIMPVNQTDEIDEQTPGDNRDCVTITVSDMASNGELIAYENTLYPNPANNYFQIMSSEAIDEISLFSATGSQVIKLHSFDGKFDISHLENGVYFAQWEEQSVVKRIKFTVAH